MEKKLDMFKHIPTVFWEWFLICALPQFVEVSGKVLGDKGKKCIQDPANNSMDDDRPWFEPVNYTYYSSYYHETEIVFSIEIYPFIPL